MSDLLKNCRRYRSPIAIAASLFLMMQFGCSTISTWKSGSQLPDFAVWEPPVSGRAGMSDDERVQRLAGPGSQPRSETPATVEPQSKIRSADNSPFNRTARSPIYQSSIHSVTPAASQLTNVATSSLVNISDPLTSAAVHEPVSALKVSEGTVVRAQSPDADSSSGVQQATYQYPELNNPGQSTTFGLPPNLGAPSERNQLLQTYEGAGNAAFPQNYADLDVYVQETQTGRINFGGAYNSDNGLVGQFIIDEHNFDIRRFPTSFRDILDGTAWRGGGQTFRLELVPGANLQRYLVSFSEPYFLNTDYSFSASGYLFERQYFDWDEERLGGRFSLGRRLNQDISINGGVRLESVTIDNPRLATSPQLNANLGNSNLFLGNVGLVRDTRDNAFLATKGTYFSATYSQAFGDYSFARGDVDYRRYRLMYERPDGSGRHTISYGTKLGFTGSSTPVFENYFAGGFSTLRGYDFRGAAPIENGVRVGGEFQWLNTLEYMFPLTADDMIRGVTFVDFGTVEDGVEIHAENFRVAPGFGFRIHMPAAGIGAPLAFDFAFPVAMADTDDKRIFSFYMSVVR